MKIREFSRQLAATVFCSLAIMGCDGSGAGPGQSGNTAVPEDVQTVYAYGIVEARQHSTLSAKFPGKLDKILVQEGQAVKEGQLLARFEARELEAHLQVALAAVRTVEAELAEALAGSREAQIAAGREQLKDAEAELSKAAADEKRYRELKENGEVAIADWEQVRLRMQSAEARRNSAGQYLRLLEEGTRPETIVILERRLDKTRVEVELAEAALENARLTAPYDGVITRKHREEGEAMDIGMPVMDIATLDNRYVRAEIDETDIGRIRPGQATEVTADGFPGLRYSGGVVEVKQQMGPKLLIPTDPSKIVDYKVLEIEVSLPPDCPFPIKLPVNVRIALALEK
jgi:ABC exporter DevB family membrane fusion protein